MIHNKIPDKVLRSLAGQYESGRKGSCVTFTVTTPEEFEPFPKTMPALPAVPWNPASGVKSTMNPSARQELCAHD